MRHVFIVNPIAGKKYYTSFVPLVEQYFAENGGAFEIFYTEYAGHAIEYVKELGRSGAECRTYACGGDGTLLEVVNGAIGFPNLSVGCVPLGSGNDFIRYFGDKSQFLNIEYQVKGSTIPIDVLKAGDEYCINQCSSGMDAMVAKNMGVFKNWPLVSGKLSYYLSLFYTFLSKIRFPFVITVDGDEPVHKECLFVMAANAPYHGGGFKGAPEADPKDGSIECVLISAVSRLRVLTLLGRYRKGGHVSLPKIYRRHPCTHVKLESQNTFCVTLDGEIRTTAGIDITIVPKAIQFIVPGVCIIKDAESARSQAVTGLAAVIPPSPACEQPPN